MKLDKRLAELTIDPHRIPLQAPGLTFTSYQHGDKQQQSLTINKLEEHPSYNYPKILFGKKPYEHEGYYAQPHSVRQTLKDLISGVHHALNHDLMRERQDMIKSYQQAIKHVWTLDNSFESHLEDALESYAAYRLVTQASTNAQRIKTPNQAHTHTLRAFYQELGQDTKDAADAMRHALTSTLDAEDKQRLYAVDESLLDIQRHNTL